MAKEAKDRTPPLGSASFWDMAALALGGRLASCQSCVEFFYFQSQENAVAFLDSCASGGLVERISLIDLRADLDHVSSSGPTLAQEWYDQAIYISAPAYRMHNLDASRDRIEGTKNAVYNAFRLYYEKLNANNNAIDAAYDQAVAGGDLLRYSDTARKRRDVDLSHVAKLRLIQDGFKCVAKTEAAPTTPLQIEKRATDLTIEYVYRYWEATPATRDAVCDRGEELRSFIDEFLDDHRELQKFWSKYETRKLPSRSHVQILQVISYLIQYCLQAQNDYPKVADTYSSEILIKLRKTAEREQGDPTYVDAVGDVTRDINFYLAGLRSSVPFDTNNQPTVSSEAR